jgi:hypothetical protein
MARTLQEIYDEIGQQTGTTFQASTSQIAPESERLRTAAQGFTFGFSDEIEGFVRSILPGGREYEVERDELRKRLAEYKRANPYEALTAETAGALATMFIPGLNVARGVQAAKAGAQSLGRVGAVGAGEGLAYGVGSSEAEDLKGMALDGASGMVTGAFVPTALTAGFRGIGSVGRAFSDFIQEKMGVKANDAVQQYLKGLADQAGKSKEEIIADLAADKVITDNATVNAALKSFILEGGKPANDLLAFIKDRRGRLEAEGESALRGQLAPGMSDNVLDQHMDMTEALRKVEGNQYNQIYAANPTVSKSVADALQQALQRYNVVRNELGKIYQAKNIVPLFKVGDDGAVELVRTPSLEDADIAYQILREETGNLYRKGRGTRAEVMKEYRDSLKQQLDTEFADLREARANYSLAQKSAESFDDGYAAINKDVDATARMMRKLSEIELASFRAGVFAGLRNQIRRSKGGKFRDLAEEKTQVGDLLRLVAPEESIDDLVRQLETTAEARATALAMPPRAGSQTQPLQRAQQRQAQRQQTAQEVVEGVTLGAGPAMLSRVLRQTVDRITQPKELTEAQRQQIVDVIISQDPQMLERAFTNRTSFDELVQVIDSMANRFAPAARTAATQQGVGLLGSL